MIPYIHIPDAHIGPLPLHPFGVLVATGVLLGTAMTTRRARQSRLGPRQAELVRHVDARQCVRALARARLALLSLGRVREAPGIHPHALGGPELVRGLHRRRGRDRPLEVPGHRERAAARSHRRLSRSSRSPTWSCRASPSGGCSAAPDARRSTTIRVRARRPTRSLRSPGRRTAGDEADDYTSGSSSFIHGHEPRFDLGLLEFFFTVILTACFALTWRKKVPLGSYMIATALAYAPVRFAMDYLRIPASEGGDTRYLGLTPAQYCCVALFVFGIAMIFYVRRLKASGVDPTLAVRAPPPEPEATARGRRVEDSSAPLGRRGPGLERGTDVVGNRSCAHGGQVGESDDVSQGRHMVAVGGSRQLEADARWSSCRAARPSPRCEPPRRSGAGLRSRPRRAPRESRGDAR